MHADIALLITVIDRLFDRLERQEQKTMATIADLNTRLDAVEASVQALKDRETNRPPSVPEADLDPVAARLDNVKAELDAIP